MKSKTTILMLVISSIVMLASIATPILFYKIIANKNEHTSAVISNLESKMARRNNIEALKKKIEEVNQTKQTVDSHFVDSKKIDAFIDYLEKLGTSVGAEVKVDNFELTAADKNTLSVRLTTTGKFSDVMQVILLLENSPYQIKITRTALMQQLVSTEITDKAGKKSTTTSPKWEAQISFNILTSI